MRFREWLQEANEAPFQVPVQKLWGWSPKIQEVVTDVLENRLSFNAGSPVTVSRLDSPRGAFFMIDGYHRVLEAMMRGETSVVATLNPHMPNIERTGGAHASMVAAKAPMSQALTLLRAAQQQP